MDLDYRNMPTIKMGITAIYNPRISKTHAYASYLEKNRGLLIEIPLEECLNRDRFREIFDETLA